MTKKLYKIDWKGHCIMWAESKEEARREASIVVDTYGREDAGVEIGKISVLTRAPAGWGGAVPFGDDPEGPEGLVPFPLTYLKNNT